MVAIAAFVVGVSLLVAAVIMCTACAPDPAVVQDQADIAAWTADDGVCVRNGHTRAEIDACRDAMRAYYCGADGGVLVATGACAHVVLSDGARP